VLPGSKAVQAIVDFETVERAFRPKGQVVAGGGINDLARDGVEVTLWPCEGSTRQEWKLNEDKQLQVFGHDWLGKPTSSCLGNKVDESFEGLLLANCNITNGNPGFFDVTEDVDSEFVKFSLAGTDLPQNANCLYLKPLLNNGGAYGERGGAQVAIGDCSLEEAKWRFSSTTGELSSSYYPGGDVCLTTGWPFLQVGAFQTPDADSSKTVIILNEAGESANYVVQDGDTILSSGSIPSHSIQTLSFD